MQKKKPFICGLEYRTNYLSLQPGGFVIGVWNKKGRYVEQPNIKNPKMYIAKALKEGAKKAIIVGRNTDKKYRNNPNVL